MPPEIDRKQLETLLDSIAGSSWSSAWRDALRAYLRFIANASDPRQKSGLLCWLAALFRKRARLRNSRHAFRYAMARAEDSLGRARAAADAVAEAKALQTLGKLFYDKGDRRADEDALARAEAIFLQALAIPGLAPHSDILAALTLDLADVHAVRHRVDGAPRHLEKARPLYRSVRKAALRLRQPSLWTRAAANLLRMERDAAAGMGDADALQRVAQRQRRVVRVLSRLEDDDQATNARHALAITLAMAADIRYDRQLLSEASRLWHDNAASWTREQRPQDWARLQHELALADFTIGEKEANPALLRDALDRFRALIEPTPRKDGGQPLPPPWSPERTPENFAQAVVNMTGIRRRLASMTADTSLLRDALLDLGRAADLFHPDTTKTWHAAILHLAGGVEAELGAMIRDPALCRSGESTQRRALALFAEIENAEGYVILAINNLADSLLQAAPLDPTTGTLERALDCLMRADGFARADATDEPALRTRRNLLAVRLALAARRGSSTELASVADDIDRMHERFGQNLVPWEAIAFDLLRADAAAVGARARRDRATLGTLLERLTGLLARRELPGPAAIACRMELGQLLLRLGHANESIGAWQEAQDQLWTQLVEIEGAGARGELIRLAGPAPGFAGLPRAGSDIALGDELALALLERNRREDAVMALGALERSRGIRRALAALPLRAAPSHHCLNALRDELRASRAACDAVDRTTITEAAKGPHAAAQAAARRQAAWSRAVQAEQAFRSALAATGNGRIAVPDAADLAAALPSGGCLAVFAIGAERGAVVTVRAGTHGPERCDLLWLPALTRHAVARLLGAAGFDESPDSLAFLPALAAVRQRGSFASFATAAHRLDRAIAHLGECLWDIAIGPLDTHLRSLGVGPGADLALMAPGTLAALPLHAAWRKTSGGIPRFFLDDWVVRFVPDLRAVLSSGARTPESPLRLLAVHDPCGDGFPPDPALRFFRGETITKLDNARATIGSVVAALSQHPTLSFSGHAVYEPLDPDRSGLALAHPSDRDANGHPIPHIFSVTALRALSASTPRDLAVLAACDTATAETADTADEFNGLPAEFLDAGFAGVVGASWPVDDAATDRLMTYFWEAYAENGHNAPAALRHAQLAMRAGPALPVERGAARAIGPAAAAPAATTDTARLPPASSPFCWAGFRIVGG
jgi:hypothetical protein